MCGRYVINNQSALEAAFKVAQPQWGTLRDSYNVAPTQSVPVIRQHQGTREGVMMRWGLVPFWAKGIPPKVSTINARVENLHTAASWRGPWKHQQRCILPASGFYEWHVNEDGSKQPYYIHLQDQDVFGFAGLWDRSTSDSGEVIDSCTIITLPASPFMAHIHNDKQREPALLRSEDHEVWLSGNAQDALASLKPYPDELLRAWPVSKRVNTPRNNDSSLIASIE